MSAEPAAAGAGIAAPGRRATTVLAGLLVALAAALGWLPRMDGPIDLRWDGGAYYIIGTSLADGQGYRLQSEPGHFPSSVHAPFLPALVAVHERILGTSDPAVVGKALRVTTVLFSVAYAVAVFLLLQAYVAWPWAVAAALLGTLQPQYAYFSDALYAETFFAFFSVAFFLLVRRRAGLPSFLLAGACAALAYEARTAGIALLVAWVVDTVLRKDFRRLPLVLAMAALPVVAWMGWIRTAEASPEYRHPAYAYQTAPYVYFNVSYAKNIFTLKDPWNPQEGPLTRRGLAERVASNVAELPARIGESLSSWEAPAGLALGLGVLALLGTVVLAAQRQFLVVGYLVLSLAAIVLTPFHKQFIRYLLPLYPFFALALCLGLARLAAAARRRLPALPRWLGPTSTGLLVLAIVLAIVLVQARDLRELYDHHDRAFDQSRPGGDDRLFHDAPLGPEYDAALAWLRQVVRPSDVVAATDPQRAYLHTGAKAVLPPFELDGARSQALIDSVPVRYLVAETEPRPLGLGAYHRFTAPLIRANPDRWVLCWTSAGGHEAIYERRASTPACAGGR